MEHTVSNLVIPAASFFRYCAKKHTDKQR